LVSEVDLNLCQQVKDKWQFQMTSRYSYYADFMNKFIQHDYQPHIVRDPALTDKSGKSEHSNGVDRDSFH